MSKTVVLLRTKSITDAKVQFLSELSVLSGHTTALIADGSHISSIKYDASVINLLPDAVAKMNIYAPQDFTWRCGDYGYYFALNMFEEATHFWMFEDDVRIFGQSPRNFFLFFDQKPEIDLLAGSIRPAEYDWYWRNSCMGSSIRPYRCFFPVTRLSRRAVVYLQNKRISQSKSYIRRNIWPNDESFVSTSVANSGFLNFADFNDFDETFYTEETYNYRVEASSVAIEEAMQQLGHARLIHPVRSRQELEIRKSYIQIRDKRSFYDRAKRKAFALMSHAYKW